MHIIDRVYQSFCSFSWLEQKYFQYMTLNIWRRYTTFIYIIYIEDNIKTSIYRRQYT
jgi:hypothetical protein